MNYKRSLIFVTVLFFLFGFITCLNDILIPHLKALFTLNYTQAMLIQVCFFSAYFFISIPSGIFTNKYGYRKGIVAGLIIAGFGTLGFLPAASNQAFPMFLISLFILASGITLLQVSVNPYVTLLGDPKLASFRLNLVQAFNSLGTALAPMIGSLLILESEDKVLGIQIPYLILTATLVIVAVTFSKLPLPTLSEYSHEDNKPASDKSIVAENFFSAYIKTLKAHPRLYLGMLAIFCYVGAEVAIGSLLVSYLGLPEIGSIDAVSAAKYVSYYWSGAMIGRFIGSVITSKFNPALVLQIVSLLSALFVLLSIVIFDSNLSLWLMCVIGLFNSIQFPTIFSLSVTNLEKDTPQASGLLCTMIVGGAFIPFIQGMIADSVSLRWSYIICIVCYGYIALSSKYLTETKKA